MGTLGATAALVAVAGCDEPPVDGPDRQARGLDVYPQCLVFLSLNHSVGTPKWPRGPVVTSRHSPHLIRSIFSSGYASVQADRPLALREDPRNVRRVTTPAQTPRRSIRAPARRGRERRNRQIRQIKILNSIKCNTRHLNTSDTLA